MDFYKEIKFGDTFQELPKSKFQVQHADNIGHFPFYTSGDNILSHSEFNVDDDLIFLATGGKANVKFHSGKAAYSTDTYTIKGKNHSSKYLYYLLLNNLSFIDRNFFSGSGLKHLQKKDLKNWLLNFPDDLSEEEKIVQILSTLDRAIASTQQLIAKYQRIKTGLLHDLLTRGIDEQGNLRSEKTHKFKNSKLGRIPVEWENSVMGKYITYNLYGPRFNAKDYSENGNVKTIRGTDFSKDGEILYSQAPIAKLPLELVNTHKLNNNDIVIVTTADCGLTAVFEQPINDLVFIPSAYAVKYKFSDEINPFFIKYFMRTKKAINQVKKYVRQGTLGNLPGSDLLKFEIAFPSYNEQLHIVDILKKQEYSIIIEQNNLYKLQSLKVGLMQDLLSGKVRVLT